MNIEEEPRDQEDLEFCHPKFKMRTGYKSEYPQTTVKKVSPDEDTYCVVKKEAQDDGHEVDAGFCNTLSINESLNELRQSSCIDSRFLQFILESVGETYPTVSQLDDAALKWQLHPTEQQPTEQQPTEQQPTEQQPTEQQPTEQQRQEVKSVKLEFNNITITIEMK